MVRPVVVNINLLFFRDYTHHRPWTVQESEGPVLGAEDVSKYCEVIVFIAYSYPKIEFEAIGHQEH